MQIDDEDWRPTFMQSRFVDPRTLPFRQRLRMLTLWQIIALIFFFGWIVPWLVVFGGLAVVGAWDAFIG